MGLVVHDLHRDSDREENADSENPYLVLYHRSLLGACNEAREAVEGVTDKAREAAEGAIDPVGLGRAKYIGSWICSDPQHSSEWLTISRNEGSFLVEGPDGMWSGSLAGDERLVVHVGGMGGEASLVILSDTGQLLCSACYPCQTYQRTE
jgi:hypothetical protein